MRMEMPFYNDDCPAVSSYSHTSQYERFPGNKPPTSKKAAPATASHHFPWGGGRGGNPSNPGDANPLVSPDLEHLIIQGPVRPGPAASNSANAFVYRNQATNEQEGFADGFVRALADLHKQNQLVGGGPASPSPSCSVYHRSPMSTADLSVYANLGSYAQGQVAFCGGSGLSGCPQLPAGGTDALQTVPEVPASPPSLSPIDLETQERIKAERKKLRNRIAASKCRRRKLERISRLEEKVAALKGHNADLASTAAALRQQVAQLKHKVASHVTNGCQIAGAGGEDC